MALLLASVSMAKEYNVVSPDGKLKVTVNDRQGLHWQITHGGQLCCFLPTWDWRLNRQRS